MERIAFLIERSGERVTCLLNPEHLDVRRIAGLRVRSDSGGAIVGDLRSDDPIIARGGGITEFELRLLFDVELANEGYRAGPQPLQFQNVRNPAMGDGDQSQGVPQSASMQRYADVRELSRPLWRLSENAESADGSAAVPVVRFIWGKSWNVPAVILAIAERFERFDIDGAPRRSWISLRLRRVQDTVGAAPTEVPATPQFELRPGQPLQGGTRDDVLEILTDQEGMPQQRLDLIAGDHYGNPAMARAIGEYNGLDDLLDLGNVAALRLPSRDRIQGLA